MLAFGNRAENKDAYDLFYLWNGIGVADVGRALSSLQPDTNVDKALCILERDFVSHDAPGPVGAAHFINRAPDDEIQADVSGQAQALLQFMGRQ